MIRYTAVVLDKDSVITLRTYFQSMFQDYLEPIGFRWQTASGEPLPHHMTLNMGSAKDKTILEEDVLLEATDWAVNNKVLVVKVKEQDFLEVASKKPHITLAVNGSQGGKPKDSADVSSWTPLPKTISLYGTIQEVS